MPGFRRRCRIDVDVETRKTDEHMVFVAGDFRKARPAKPFILIIYRFGRQRMESVKKKRKQNGDGRRLFIPRYTP